MKVRFKKRGENDLCYFLTVWRVIALLSHLTTMTAFNSVALLFNYRLQTTDSQCRYGWKAGNRPVYPPEVEGAFTGG